MTRSMKSRLECPTCKCHMSSETHFERWMRNEKLLHSSIGVVRFDLDVLLHRYMIKEDGIGRRDIQALMFIEVKTWGSELTDAQEDTMHLLNQVLRNRKRNIHGTRDKWNLKEHVPLGKAKSLMSGKHVALRMFGGHVLRFEKDGPDGGGTIQWDKTFIGAGQLVRLLRFELDPDDPRMELDIRRRSKPLPLLDVDTTETGGLNDDNNTRQGY